MDLQQQPLHQDGCRRQPSRAPWQTGGLVTAMVHRGWNSVANFELHVGRQPRRRRRRRQQRLRVAVRSRDS